MQDRRSRLGRWRIERVLGHDLTGIYYAAHRDGGERATLYLPSDEVATREHALTHLLEQHRRLTHPALVRFHDIDEAGDERFLIAGAVEDAVCALRSARRPAPGQARPLGSQLAAALVTAHDHGVFHGGLELDNVLWAADRAPRVLGLGAAVLDLTEGDGLAHGDVVALGRLLCVLIAGGQRTAAEAPDRRARELICLLADPSAGITMREAHALLDAGEPARGRRGAARGEPTHEMGPAEPTLTMPAEPTLTMPAQPTSTMSAAAASIVPPAAPPAAPLAAPLAAPPAAPLAAPVPVTDEVNRPLSRYRILSRLGRGGMGEVLLADDPVLCRGVAIKRIRPGLEHDRTFRARLRREAQLAARLSHRAIVQVFDLITSDHIDHMIMEYVPGPSLYALLAGNPMAVPEVVRIAAELADGLAYAHQHGVVHRDLKLENVLLATDGQPKIADFGIARRLAAGGDAGEPVTREGVLIGTSRAMSPEQVEGREVDARSDLFSFGVLLYELLTGTSPFASSVHVETLQRVLYHRQAPVHARMPEVPRPLSDLVDHLLEKRAEHRPETALAVRDRLRRMVDAVADPAPVAELAMARGSSSTLPGHARPPAQLRAGVTAAAAPSSASSEIRGALAREAHGGDRSLLTARMQAPFILAEIRALRASIFKKAPEIQSALAIADQVEHAYDLRRIDLFIPVVDSFSAILEPFASSVLTGTLRRIGYEIFPQYMTILGIAAREVKPAMHIDAPADLVRVICEAYSKCVIGAGAGALRATVIGSRATITDTTFMPCQLQIGVFLGAGKLTGLYGDAALTEKRCRTRGDRACVYELAL